MKKKGYDEYKASDFPPELPMALWGNGYLVQILSTPLPYVEIACYCINCDGTWMPATNIENLKPLNAAAKEMLRVRR